MDPREGLQPLSRERAELVGLQVLGWIAARRHLARRFLDAAGSPAEEMHARAADPEFLGFVLDFLLAEEEELIAFASQAGVPPNTPYRARLALPGGEMPHWT